MPLFILDVGNCQPDHSALARFLTGHFDCQVVQAHGLDDALAELKSRRYDLVLVNRKLDRDYSDGIDIIREIKADAAIAGVPCMLITNFPDHQDAAVEIGAVRGFGKLEFSQPETLEKLKTVLSV
jgi:DNA-binding response OmpR family regulator